MDLIVQPGLNCRKLFILRNYWVRQNIYAHTAPIIISVDNQPILVKPEAQQVKNDLLIQREYYLKNAKYKENKHREKMMDLFDRAIILIDNKISGK